MSDTTFAVGDRVLVLGKFRGEVTNWDKTKELPYVVRADRTGALGAYHESDLERIDEEADSATVPAGVAGPSGVDGGSPGSTTQPATEESTVPSLEELAWQVASLKFQVRNLEALAHMQAELSAVRRRLVEPRTTSRVHTKIVKGAKDYRHEISAEVTSDDPTVDITVLVVDLLEQADKDARRHIIDANYRDDSGLPGDDEEPPY